MIPALLLTFAAAIAGEPVPAVDFDTEIIPILTKAGCNSGACHGAAVGRGGFGLSLYGSNPQADFQAITQQWEGRRINLSRPDRSLVFRKPTGDMNHGGDQRFSPASESAERLLRWIEEGAVRRQSRRLVQLDVTPTDYVAGRIGDTVDVSITAVYDDGSTEDVTRWTVLKPDDPAAVTLSESGDRATISRRGSHLVTARFLDQVQPMVLTVPLCDEPLDPASLQTSNRIDEFINARLSTLRLPVSPPADDPTLLRRLSLDLAGRLPAVEQTTTYLADPSPDKYDRLLDELLRSDAFVDYWTFEFAKLLRVRPLGNDRVAAETFHHWLRQQLQAGTPYDALARTLLTAEGDSHVVGAASFHRGVGGAREQAEFVSELFMGAKLACANCHDHPLDRWTQDDYHGLSAIFARIERGQVVAIADRGEVSHPRTQEAAVPRIPGERFLPTEGDGRDDLADWLTSPDNPYFARAIVNRLWQQMLGRGLVEPVDDLRTTNPGTHPALLEWLAEDFVAHGYDLRHTLRLIAESAAYQRSSQPIAQNAADEAYYSHFLETPLEAEVLADAVADVTGVPFAYGETTLGTRAIDLIDPNVNAPGLDVLGRCDREESCESAAASAGGVAVKLHLLNGPFLNRSITDDAGRLAALLADGATFETIVEDVYLRALCRRPTADERAFWIRQTESINDIEKRELAEDFLWSVLTCREFVTNH